MPPVKINGQIVELSSCLLSVVGLCVLSVPSLRQEARQCLIIESERMRESEREGDRETKTKRRREKETWGGEREGRQRETERELRPVKIHHDVRHTDTLQPQIHHRNRVCRHNWTQETSELEKRSGARTGEERRGKRGQTKQIGYYSWPKAPVRTRSAAKENHVMPRTLIFPLYSIVNISWLRTQPP